MNIGAAWIRQTKEGKKYLSCKIEVPRMDLTFQLFQNVEKKSEKAPDYNIVWRKPQDDAQKIQEQFGAPVTGAPVSNDDIPF